MADTVRMKNAQGAIANPQVKDQSKWEAAGWWVDKPAKKEKAEK